MMTLALISESFALLALIWTIAYATQLAVADLLWLVEARRQDVEYAWWSRAKQSPIMIERIVARQVVAIYEGTSA
jgi:hypothetical protein